MRLVRSVRRRWSSGLRGRLTVMAAGAVGAVVLVSIPVVAALAWLWTRPPVSTVGDLSFENELRIPPLAESIVDSDGTRVFTLSPGEVRAQLRPGEATDALGYDGTYGGPTLRASRGETVRVEVTNELSEATTVHWHGMALPAVADGGPHSVIEPGGTWHPTWTIDQPAATLWYHPHLHHQTESQVRRGLAGLFIVDDPEATSSGLPERYGVDDIPVIVQDQSFGGANSLRSREPAMSSVGHLGDHLLVNGTWNPHFEVTAEATRLRLLNGSAARVYQFGFDDGRPFDMVATDGGLLAHPVSLREIRLSPGERAEIVVRLAPGDRTVLRSNPPDLGVNFIADRTDGGRDSFDVLELRAADDLTSSPSLPGQLVSDPRTLLDPDDAVATWSLRLSGNSNINGRSMDMRRIDRAVRAGSVEIWEVSASSQVHNFHVHDVQFLVLDIDGRPPPPELSGWKDTVYLGEGGTFRLVMRFSDHPDPNTPYMFHCHLLRHEDNGMMGQFVVTADGRAPDRLPDDAVGHRHDE